MNRHEMRLSTTAKLIATSKCGSAVQFLRHQSKAAVGITFALAAIITAATSSLALAQYALPHGARVIGVEHNYVSHDGSRASGSLRGSNRCISKEVALTVIAQHRGTFFRSARLQKGDDHEIDLITITASEDRCGPGQYFHRHYEIQRYHINAEAKGGLLYCHPDSHCGVVAEDLASIEFDLPVSDPSGDLGPVPPRRHASDETIGTITPTTDLICTFPG